MDFGTGALKITPAHDPNDYQVGKRHGLAMPSMLTIDGKLNDLYPPYKGLTVLEARERAVKELTEKGNLVKIEPSCIRWGIVSDPAAQSSLYDLRAMVLQNNQTRETRHHGCDCRSRRKSRSLVLRAPME